MHRVLINNIQITNARNAGKLIGLPESKITDITFRNIQMTANTDVTIRDTEDLKWENIPKTITPAAAGPAEVPQPVVAQEVPPKPPPRHDPCYYKI